MSCHVEAKATPPVALILAVFKSIQHGYFLYFVLGGEGCFGVTFIFCFVQLFILLCTQVD